MFHGTLALLERSLRVDARSWQSHLVRFGLMFGIYLCLVFAVAMSWRVGAPGLQFFSASLYLNIVFLTLLGIGLFSTTITEEKEEDTLGLMLMAGISPLGLLAGKLAGRLLQALLLIAVQYPFTLLAITMGGVTSAQIQAAYIGLACYTLMLAGLGLLCSTLAPRSRTAGTWMVIALMAYGLIPYFCGYLGGLLTPYSTADRYLQWIASMSLFRQAGAILATGFGESPWNSQVTSNLLLGALCCGLAWCSFGTALREPVTEVTTRGGLSRNRSGLSSTFSPGRTWNNPFVWKDFYFISGGLSRLLIRMVLYPALFGVAWIMSITWSAVPLDVYQVFLLWALLWEMSLLTATAIQAEVRGQTIASLVMLPGSVVYFSYSKLLGALAGTIPGLTCLFIACLFDVRGVYDFLRHEGDAIVSLLLLIPHYTAVYALFVRWGAVPLGFGTMVATYFLVVLAFQSGIVSPAGVHAVTVVMLMICVACHVFVVSSIPRLAAR
ncbi:MAG: ABC transporter permease subunit [Planctomycetes bacterium]|nr:ABC transporter permease subunit [Planctomycetota bacterium]